MSNKFVKMLQKKIPSTTSHSNLNMGRNLLSESFKIYTSEEDHKNPKNYPFLLSTTRGFLPRQDPILDIPSKCEPLDILLKKMRWDQPDGSEGLLAKKQLGEAVLSELPELDVDENNDTMLDLALFRDYSFLTSAYLLEECHHNFLKTGKYGLGRPSLPLVLSRPFVKLSEKLKLKPFMEYNSCYALNNYYKIDPKEGLAINNLEIFRTFINMKSESGFIKVHIAINQHGGMLIKSGIDVLKACEQNNRRKFNESFKEMKDVMSFMNGEFERMYYESNPADYNIFRTFILGTFNQPMFPEGVVYEGCYDNKPTFFRGESGANDSIIPFCDNILEITQFFPKNPLTDILRDFRSYRPATHQEFLKWTEETATKLNVLEYAKHNPESMLYLLEVADEVRAFRHRHWILTNLYIMNYSKHPVATGGSPIITWLPNQLLTVIDFIKNHAKYVKGSDKERDVNILPSYLEYNIDSIVRRCEADERIIKREVEKRRKSFGQ
jgi:indoleamine 2,3-dioxygenase